MNLAQVKDRALGCFVGAAVGDALGAPVEFMQPGTFVPVTGYRAGGPFNLKAGEWTDDTSMALALAETLEIDPLVQNDYVLKAWCRWHDHGAYSHNGRCFDIGGQTRASLLAFKAGRAINETASAGNGGIMRMSPIITRWWYDNDQCQVMAVVQGVLTHNNAECCAAATLLAQAGATLVAGGYAENLPTSPPAESTGYVVDTAQLALWSLNQGGDFLDMVLRVVNMGGDSDTAGAVTGMLAGAQQGLSGIPPALITGLAWSDKILAQAERLWEASLQSIAAAAAPQTPVASVSGAVSEPAA